jgi:hypothetical protein
MAQQLDDRGHGRVTTDLLERVERIVPERQEGAEIAQFIDLMLDRSDKQGPRTRGRCPRFLP